MTPGAKSILLVEAEEKDAQQIRLAFMKSSAWRPMRVVRDGQEAIEYLRGFGKYRDRTKYPFPCFMIVDLASPRINGLQLLGWLKMQPEFDELPRVVLAASTQEQDRKLAEDLGCRYYFVKPHGFEQLIEFSRTLGSCGAPDAKPLHSAGTGVEAL